MTHGANRPLDLWCSTHVTHACMCVRACTFRASSACMCVHVPLALQAHVTLVLQVHVHMVHTVAYHMCMAHVHGTCGYMCACGPLVHCRLRSQPRMDAHPPPHCSRLVLHAPLARCLRFPLTTILPRSLHDLTDHHDFTTISRITTVSLRCHPKVHDGRLVRARP